MRRLSSKQLLLASTLAAALAGAAGGAGIYALLSPSSTTTTKVVRQVSVESQAQAAQQGPLSVNQIYRRTYRGVVEITIEQGGQSFPGAPQGAAQGSGFVLDKQGHVITNQHVVAGSSAIQVKFWNGAVFKAQLVGSDRSTDVAVVKVDAPKSLLSPLPLGDSSKVQVGDGVVAIGSPFGLEESVTSGIVSALHRQMTSPNGYAINDSIQTDAAINHGNSGGPLIDTRARVIGINAQIAGDSGGNEGVGFAIPVNTVRAIADQLIAHGHARHAYLGVSLETIPAAVAARTNLVEGVELAQVKPNTPAARAALRGATGTTYVDGEQYSTGGDVITAIDGNPVRSAEAVESFINSKQPGDRIEVTYVRNGATHTVALVLGTRPS